MKIRRFLEEIALRWGEVSLKIPLDVMLCKKMHFSYSSSVVPCQSVNGELGQKNVASRKQLGKDLSFAVVQKGLCLLNSWVDASSTLQM